MATRSRTFLFIQYRSSYGHSNRGKVRDGYDSALYRPIEYAGLIQDNSAHHEIYQMSELPPLWVEKVQQINLQLEDIEKKIGALGRLHSQHLLPGFTDRTEEEQLINDMTKEITKGFQECQQTIHAIYDPNLEGQKITVTKNVQMSLAQKLQTQSQSFQAMQGRYLKEISKHSNQSRDVFELGDEIERRRHAGGSGPGLGLGFDQEHNFDLSLTNEQAMDLELLSVQVSDREAEIENIHKSIYELSSVFKDMQQLVISQGTLLDRIDYNIENTVVHVQAASDELTKAEKSMRNSVERKAILSLTMIVVILLLILVLKNL